MSRAPALAELDRALAECSECELAARALRDAVREAKATLRGGAFGNHVARARGVAKTLAGCAKRADAALTAAVADELGAARAGPGGSDAPSRPRLASAAPDVGGRRPVPSSVVPTAPRRSPTPRRARDVPFDPAKDDAATYALRRDLAALDHEETLARLTTARAETLAVRLVRFRPAPAVGVDRAKPRPDDDAEGRTHRPPLTIRRRVSSCVDPNAKPVHFLVRRAVRAQNESLAPPDPRAESRDEDALAAMLPDVREKMQLHSAVRCLYRLAAADSDDDSDASSDEDEPEIENAAPPKGGPSFAAREEAAVRGSSSPSKSPGGGGGGGAPRKKKKTWTRVRSIRDVRHGDVLAVRCACDDPPPGRASSRTRESDENPERRETLARLAKPNAAAEGGVVIVRALPTTAAGPRRFFSDGTTRATRPVSAPPAFVDVGSDATDQTRHPPRKEGGAFVGSGASSLAPRPLLVRVPPAYKTPESALAAVSRAVLAARRSHSPAIALYDETLAPVVDFDAQIRDAGGVVFYRCAHHPAPAPAGAGRRQRAADEKLSAVKEGKERSFAVVAVRRERNGAKAVVRRRETIHVPDRPGLLSMSLSALRRRVALAHDADVEDVVSMRVGGRELEHPAQLEPGAKLFWSAEKRSAVKNARSEGDHFRQGNDEPREKKRPGRRPASAGGLRHKTRNAFAEEVFSSGVAFSSGVGVGAPPSSLSPPSSPAAEAARAALALGVARRGRVVRRPPMTKPLSARDLRPARPPRPTPRPGIGEVGFGSGVRFDERALRSGGGGGARVVARRGGEKAKKRKGAVGARKARRAIEIDPIDPIDRGGGGALESGDGAREGVGSHARAEISADAVAFVDVEAEVGGAGGEAGARRAPSAGAPSPAPEVRGGGARLRGEGGA